MEKAYKNANERPAPPPDYISPHPVPQTTNQAVHPSVVPFVTEMQGSSPLTQPSLPSEKMGDTVHPTSKSLGLAEKADDGRQRGSLISEKMDDTDDDSPSELDGTPVDAALPRYSDISR